MNAEVLLQEFKGDVSSLDAFLKTLAARILQKIRRDPQFMRLMYFSGLEGHKLASTVYERTMHCVGGFIAAQFQAAIDRGELRGDLDTHLAARAFTGMVAHHALVSEVFHFDANRWSDEELVNTFTSVFLEGLRKKAVKRS
jgi:hypothetical protein